MSSSNFSINHNAVASGAADDIAVGMAVLKTDDGYVVATSANRTLYGRRSDGIAITAAEAGESFQLMHDALCDAVHSGLATGTASDWVRVKSDGTLERTATVSSGDDVIGRCPGTNGDFHVLPNLFDSTNYAGGGGGGGGTVPTGTGFTHITAGAQDAASKKVDLTASADVTVPTTGIVTSNGSVLASFAPGTNVQTFLTTPSSANLRAALTDETGTGAAVFANTPALVTPDIGAATGTSLALGAGFVSIGNSSATTDGIYMANTFAIYCRNFANAGNIRVAYVDASDQVVIGTAGNTLQLQSGTATTQLKADTFQIVNSGGTIVRFKVNANGSFVMTDSGGNNNLTFQLPDFAADRVLNVPLLTADDTIVTAGFTQTLTNKTLTSPTVNNGSLVGCTITTSVTVSGNGVTTQSNGTKGTSYDKAPITPVQTTDATVTTLDSFTLASNTVVAVTWLVVGVRSTLAEAAAYSVSACFKNNAGTVAQVGTTLVTVLGESNSAWDCTIDNSTTTIRLRVTGAAATTIQWDAIMTRLDVIP